jgi:hypothetical protein
MARLHLTVEGPTEQAFAANVLIPYLAVKGVYLSKAQLAAHAKKRGQVHRGGLTRYLPFRNDVVRRLKEDQGSDVFLSTMIDLYALPDDFPGAEAARSQCDPYRRVETVERALAEDVGDGRFIPYIQLHEFEAMLLAKPDAILKYYDDRQKEVAALNQLVEEFSSPELIDDGENSAPSKRIIARIPEYGEARAKPTAGPIIAAAIGLETIRAKCPHFDAWLRRLEQLGETSR